MRFIILAAIIFIALLLINRALGNARQAIQRDKNQQRANNIKAVSIVKCAHCGVHLPENEAVHYHDQTWCSLEHAKEADKQ
ncbi:Uncharacterised protein [Oligella ureolytica]|uniref:MYND finger n=1 Tax=Oligella ureolytica TaxID=90244 RepID=A0A378XFF3_9BURK|nr:PP0621 family protein [Oligella ureolytica]QPT41020.1 hypothetical protein I6G29_05610 [Oligella ureolytica]SUA53460.1 Uncharacterised protein [Oligella ureolytica]SUA53529.1 Uncharacterised protein [Oligella ureolytica]